MTFSGAPPSVHYLIRVRNSSSYLTPPVGMNLFRAAYRFDKPLLQVYRSALPFLLVFLLVVLLVTYFPP